MTDVFPPCFANRAEMVWDLPGAFTSGGTSVFGGESQVRRMDGGGGWRAMLQNLVLKDAANQKTWQAIWQDIMLGNTKYIVPRPPHRLKASFVSTGGSVPWSDDVPFSDDSEWYTGSGLATLAAEVELRAVEAQIILPPGAALEGGEPFTIVGPTYGARLYHVARVLDVAADEDGDTVTVRFGPPAREDYAAESEVDFENPRCTMRAVPNSDGAAVNFSRSRFATASIVFEETFT